MVLKDGLCFIYIYIIFFHCICVFEWVHAHIPMKGGDVSCKMSFHLYLYQNRAKEPQMLTVDFLHEMMSECVSQPDTSSGQLTVDPGRGVPGLPLLVLHPGCAVGTTSLHLDPKMLVYHCCVWIAGSWVDGDRWGAAAQPCGSRRCCSTCEEAAT